MVRNARFSWNDEDHFEIPDRASGLDDLDDFHFDGFETARRKRSRADLSHDGARTARPDDGIPTQRTTDN